VEPVGPQNQPAVACDKSVAKRSQPAEAQLKSWKSSFGVRSAVGRQASPQTAIDSQSLQTMRRGAARSYRGSELRQCIKR
jgi:hypothetical protein